MHHVRDNMPVLHTPRLGSYSCGTRAVFNKHHSRRGHCNKSFHMKQEVREESRKRRYSDAGRRTQASRRIVRIWLDGAGVHHAVQGEYIPTSERNPWIRDEGRGLEGSEWKRVPPKRCLVEWGYRSPASAQDVLEEDNSCAEDDGALILN
ncbi:hypothetical protein C8R44DRAFT_733883 [Mycena epipterygia]|nr:hypothetical protein C8R44DRAFT_733883 [Mycena epipterygia]